MVLLLVMDSWFSRCFCANCIFRWRVVVVVVVVVVISVITVYCVFIASCVFDHGIASSGLLNVLQLCLSPSCYFVPILVFCVAGFREH
jgi:hypothetical protein